MTQSEFIQTIVPYHQKYAKKYGFKIVSAAIAQACLESGYGTGIYNDNRNKVRNPYTGEWRHNYFGLKYRPNRVNCNCGYFTSSGTEQLADGSYIPTTTDWYKFETLEKGIEGYYQFINIANYAAVKLADNPLTYLQAIKNAGYATSLDYVKNVYAVVQKWNLTQYDNFLQNSSSSSTNDIKIIQSPGIYNLTSKPNRNIDYIVLHYTAGTRSKSGTARGVANYFNKSTTKASADFIVDDAEIVQYNQNINNYYTWAVGGKLYSQKSTSIAGRHYEKCTNQNSISIEMCSNKLNTSSLNASDDDWFFTNETINNAVKLVRYLMKQYNININHVIMHHEVTGKWCPQPWVKNELALTNWYNFLNKIQAGAGASASIQSTQPVETKKLVFPKVPFIVQVIVPNLNIRKTPNGEKTGKVTGIGKFTIVEVKDGWGKLKSSLGWILINNSEYVKF